MNAPSIPEQPATFEREHGTKRPAYGGGDEDPHVEWTYRENNGNGD